MSVDNNNIRRTTNAVLWDRGVNTGWPDITWLKETVRGFIDPRFGLEYTVTEEVIKDVEEGDDWDNQRALTVGRSV